MKSKWEYKKLGDVAKISSGKSIPAEKIAEIAIDGMYPCYGGNGLRGYTDSFLYDGKYPIIGRVGALCGNVHLAEGRFYPTEHALVVSLKSADVPEYITYLLSSLHLNRFAKGVAQPVLSAGTLAEIKVPIPPLSEQQRIVAELDLLAGIIDKQKAQLKELDTLAQSIFYDMFGDPIENEKGWEVKTIKEIGKVVTGNTPSRLVKEYYDKPYIEWIKSDNLSNDYMFASTAREYLSELGMSKARVLPIGSTLVTCIAGSLSTIGTASLVDRKVAFNQQINAIVPNENLVSDLFVLHTIRRIGKIIREHATNGMKHIITKAVFEKLPFILPPLALQQSFADKIQSIERQKLAIKTSIADTQKLLDYTMDKYFG